MGKPDKGQFYPKNPTKYLGGNINEIIYRSSWEHTAMRFFDEHPNVIGWMSEALPSNHVKKGLSGIPYENPFTKRWSFYIPDFFVIYMDKHGKQHAEVIEVKPLDEVPPAISGFRGKVSRLKQGRQIINAAKYEAALKYCAKHGFFFRLCTEKDMFAFQRPTR
jgi:hypothetical protein